jgi:colicin import membrane protein
VKKFILVSLVLHFVLAASLLISSQSENNSDNLYEKNKNDSNFLKNNENSTSNITKDEIMNAIAITEEELEEEVLRLQEVNSLEDNNKEQKYKFLEESLRLEKQQIERIKDANKKIIENDRKSLNEKKNELQDIQNNIIEDQNKLSIKEKEVKQKEKDAINKNNNSKEMIDYVNNTKSKHQNEMSNKNIQIEEQSEYIRRQEVEIKKLQENLKKEYRDKIKNKKITITDSKQKKNKFLNSLPKKERDNLKIELTNYNLIIHNKVREKWTYNGSIKGVTCYISITQSNIGVVLSIRLSQCDSNEEFRKSIRKAVWESSPLPLPKNKMLFDKNVPLYFTVN